MAKLVTSGFGELLMIIMTRIIGEEVREWIRWLTKRVMLRAVSRLPAEQQRFDEEWRSHLDEVPGDVGKLMTALGFLLAARRMMPLLAHRPARSTLREVTQRAYEIVVSAGAIFFVAPVCLLAAFTIKLESKGPIISRTQEVDQNGRAFLRYRFRLFKEISTAPGHTSHLLTRTGWVLLRTGLDELPSLANVLKGDIRLSALLRALFISPIE
jgi:sugar transferase